MVRNAGCKNGLNSQWNVDTFMEGDIEQGYGTPTHSAPQGTIYQDLDGTTTGHTYRNSDGAGTWAAMSDD